jgi:hypothetical protein
MALNQGKFSGRVEQVRLFSYCIFSTSQISSPNRMLTDQYRTFPLCTEHHLVRAESDVVAVDDEQLIDDGERHVPAAS